MYGSIDIIVSYTVSQAGRFIFMAAQPVLLSKCHFTHATFFVLFTTAAVAGGVATDLWGFPVVGFMVGVVQVAFQ
jgi:hypothetical protein